MLSSQVNSLIYAGGRDLEEKPETSSDDHLSLQNMTRLHKLDEFPLLCLEVVHEINIKTSGDFQNKTYHVDTRSYLALLQQQTDMMS